MTKRNTPLRGSDMQSEEAYQTWLRKAAKSPVGDDDVTEELYEMRGDIEKIKEAFCGDLAFGTGGIRGILGAGPNRMNVHTVARASQGLADYVIMKASSKQGQPGQSRRQEQGLKIAVSYDSRIKSRLFAKIACQVFASNGIKAYLYPRLMPTPCLSFAVRRLRCAAGVMVTASHNPKEYNGYKVYGEDGCQITLEAADAIYERIEKLDMFDDIRTVDFQAGVEDGKIEYISQDVYADFIREVQGQSVLGDAMADKNISIVYSPLNGTGLRPVTDVLKESGYTNITVVREQKEPDGNFPTCPYPNPEMREALTLGLEYAKKNKAALMLATDPDCDRLGVAVRDKQGSYVLLTGNETGILLLDYICSRRRACGIMPKEPVAAKTIVTTGMGEQICAGYGVKMVNVLTGFKFIGEQIGILESEGRAGDFIFGFEESYGYLSGSYVRDKDGVGAALLVCEMCAYYASLGMDLMSRLNELYEMYGFCIDSLHSYKFPGAAGFTEMERLMDAFRRKNFSFGGMKVREVIDYGLGINGLPKSNVLKFLLDEGCSVVIRPSGTEPKLKVYISVRAKSREEAGKLEKEIAADMQELIAGREE